MEWIPCEEQVRTIGYREGHCATCLTILNNNNNNNNNNSNEREEWVLCVGGYCEGERDGIVIASNTKYLPALRWVSLNINNNNNNWFECDGASLTRVEEEIMISNTICIDTAYMFGGLDAEMNYSNRLIRLALQNINNIYPQLYVEELITFGEIPLPRTQHSAGVTGNFIIIFGGATDREEQTNDMYQLNIKTLMWRYIKTESIAPSPRILAGPLVFISNFISVMYGGAHFVNGDIKSFNDIWVCDFSCNAEWKQINNNNNLFPRSNGHSGDLFQMKDDNTVVFVGGKDASEGCNKVKQIQKDKNIKDKFNISLIEPIIHRNEAPHWRYTPAAVKCSHGLLLLGGQCRHPQNIAVFLLRYLNNDSTF